MPDYKTPGVYIDELSLLPGTIVPVPTAVPAFIGHTARAERSRRSLRLQPTRITSFAEFQSLFGVLAADRATPSPDSAQIASRFVLTPATLPSRADLRLGEQAWNLDPEESSLSYFYLSVKLFYANGGGPCYIVSVGRPHIAVKTTESDANQHLKLDQFLAGLTALEREADPSLVIIPDATLLKTSDYAALNEAALHHCAAVRSRLALLDVRGAATSTTQMWTNDVASFRASVGEFGLRNAAAYYPFLHTNVLAAEAITVKHLGGVRALRRVLSDAGRPPVDAILTQLSKRPASGNAAPAVLEAALRDASPDYARVHALALARMNILPPSGAVAGAIATNDRHHGVWKSPANVPLHAVTDLTISVNDRMQDTLNVDPSSGKSINAIRVFPGKGLLVWGARTLDGNNAESRYLSIRRTSIMIGQSIKQALQPFRFEPNQPSTWTAIRRLVENFLHHLWRQGALVGSKPEHAYAVRIGLGASMTEHDVSDGILRVAVMLAFLRPGEFHVLTFQQQQTR